MARKLATDGIGLAIGRTRSLQLVLLAVHLVLLIGLLGDRGPADAANGDVLALAALTGGVLPGTAVLALASGVLLGCLTIAIATGMVPRRAGERDVVLPVPTALPALPVSGAVVTGDGLVARLNHDFRTPLNAIIGFAELMRSEAFGPLGNDRYKTYVAHMERCGHDLLRATECTLAMASLMTRPPSHREAAVPLAPLVRGLWNVVTTRSPCAALAVMEIADEICVRCDGDAIRSSLAELLGVAGDRAGSSGSVRIEAHAGHGSVELVIRVADGSGVPSPRAGCRSSPIAAVEELSIAAARALLGMQGISLCEAQNLPGTWQCSLAFEDAAQRELFAEPPAAAAGGYGFGLAPSASRSA